MENRKDKPWKLLSCDTHVEHLATALKDYVPASFHETLETCPLSFKFGNYLPFFGKDGVQLNVLSGFGRWTEVGRGVIDLARDRIPGTYGGPDEYIKWLDQDGVTAAVIIPGFGFGSAVGAAKGTRDRDTYLAVLQGYNNWLSDFCSAYPDRLLGCAMVPTSGIDDAIAELRRVRKLPGIRTVGPSAFPHGGNTPRPEDDRYWAETLDLKMPITGHGGWSSAKGGFENDVDVLAFLSAYMDPITGGAYTASQLIVGGVFDRFPDLRVVFGESGAGFVPYMADMMNHMYARHHYWAGVNLKQPPSWYLTGGNLLWNIIADRTALKLRDDIGVANLSWSSDFPHANSEWPHSVPRMVDLFANVSDEERHQILWANAAKFYHIEEAAQPLSLAAQ